MKRILPSNQTARASTKAAAPDRLYTDLLLLARSVQVGMTMEGGVEAFATSSIVRAMGGRSEDG